ncbi:helicase-related protein [Paludibacterium denitrificans]|uniref:helicase-related protein n=1 Tax=Paludibacterium denitrificans TaxID=2675226 RepID=UPI0028AC351D|nr:helicase-related protein [Paludibacterium denitrificans]
MLVFTRTKHGANRLAERLDKIGIPSAAIHGNKSQNARTRALADFKDGTLQVLVATDIAARGLDIDQLPQVVNFELPNVPEDYVHRIGRTGRAGSTGQALSLVCVDEFSFLRDIEKLTKQSIERITVPGFEADLSVKPEPIPMGGAGRGRGQGQGQRSRSGRVKVSTANRVMNNRPSLPVMVTAPRPMVAMPGVSPPAGPQQPEHGHGTTCGHPQQAVRPASGFGAVVASQGA